MNTLVGDRLLVDVSPGVSPVYMTDGERVRYSVLSRASVEEFEQLKDAPVEWLELLSPNAVVWGPYFREIDSVIEGMGNIVWSQGLVDEFLQVLDSEVAFKRYTGRGFGERFMELVFNPGDSLVAALRGVGRSGYVELLVRDERFDSLRQIDVKLGSAGSGLIEKVFVQTVGALVAFDLIRWAVPQSLNIFTRALFESKVHVWKTVFGLPECFDTSGFPGEPFIKGLGFVRV